MFGFEGHSEYVSKKNIALFVSRLLTEIPGPAIDLDEPFTLSGFNQLHQVTMECGNPEGYHVTNLISMITSRNLRQIILELLRSLDDLEEALGEIEDALYKLVKKLETGVTLRVCVRLRNPGEKYCYSDFFSSLREDCQIIVVFIGRTRTESEETMVLYDSRDSLTVTA
jgi:hypothetical protein